MTVPISQGGAPGQVPSAPAPHWIELAACHLLILGICALLIGAFWFQFVDGELPCPLCMIQRMCLLLAAIGPAFVIAAGRAHHHYGLSIIGGGVGMAILAAVGGMSVSARQVLLHISPSDPGYGTPVLGLHMYTWALLAFLAIIVTSAVTIILSPQLESGSRRPLPWYSRATLTLLGAIMVANAIAALVESGPNLFLPDNPDHYEGMELLPRSGG